MDYKSLSSSSVFKISFIILQGLSLINELSFYLCSVCISMTITFLTFEKIVFDNDMN